MKKLYLILIGIFLISFISASVEHTASTDTICENGVCSLLKDVGISGMEIKEIKINNNILSKWIGEFDNSNYLLSAMGKQMKKMGMIPDEEVVIQ